MSSVSHTFEPKIGAEAMIDLILWDGKPAIRKMRVPKYYRSEELDKILRTRRTKEEVELLHNAKLVGVDCPEIFFADPESSEIIMEYIEGILLKDFFKSGSGKSRSTEDAKQQDFYKRLGRYTAKLHSRGIIHGDLTTKNVIISGTRLVLIDFGLSFVSDRLEDRAEDLHLLKQALKSSLPLISARKQFDNVINGYEGVQGERQTKSIRSQIAKIELRGRYAQVD